MIIDTEKLISQSNYAKLKGFSRQYVGQLVQEKKLDTVKIDGLTYIIIKEKPPK